MSTEISENLKMSKSGRVWASDRRIFRRCPVLTHNFQQTVTRRAPSCKGYLRALRVIRRRGQTGPTGTRTQTHFFDTFGGFSRDLVISFGPEQFFPKLEILIYRMVSASCPSMRSRKSYWGSKLSLMSTKISKIVKISNSGQLWASDGRIFRQFPVLTHNFHQPVTRRAPSCKGFLRALRVIR